MFRFGIELSTYEYDYRRNPKPSHKSNSSAKRTIGFIIAPEVLSIPRKQQRDSEPRHCREHAAGCYPAPLRFVTTGSKPIDYCGAYRQDIPSHTPRPWVTPIRGKINPTTRKTQLPAARLAWTCGSKGLRLAPVTAIPSQCSVSEGNFCIRYSTPAKSIPPMFCR